MRLLQPSASAFYALLAAPPRTPLQIVNVVAFRKEDLMRILCHTLPRARPRAHSTASVTRLGD